MIIKKRVLLLIILFNLIFMPAPGGVFAQPKKSGTLVIGRGADSVTLDPAKSDDLESNKVLENIFEGLVRYKDNSTEIEPCLAISWESSKNETEWVFHLRKGVLFHDGTAFNADAVTFSFLRQIDSQHPYYDKNYKYAEFTFQYVQKVEKLDDYTVRISLEKPYAPFLYNLAMVSANIVSPTAVNKWRDEFWKYPVGTGPFRFDKWVRNSQIVLKKNTQYWDQPPYLDRLVFKSTLDNEDRLLELKTSSIQVMDGISPESLNEIIRHKELRLDTKPGINVGYLAMNTEKKPFDNVKVRQAVNHAINKQNLIKLLYRGMAVPAKNPIPPTLWGYADDVVDYDYNPSKAKQLLKEAGYENGFAVDLWAMPVPRPYMPDPEKIARAIKMNLSTVGIRANIVTRDWDAYLAQISNGEHEMCLLGWTGDNGDPDNFLYVLLDQDNAVKPKAENIAFFKNESLHDLLLKAQQISNRDARTEFYHQAQEIIHREAPWVPLAHAQQVVAFHHSIHGITQHPTGIIRFQKVWIE